MELFWPSLLCPNASDMKILDSAGRFTSPMNGFTQTISRPGDRLRMSLQLRNLTGQQRGLLIGFIAGMRGGINRVRVRDHSSVARGSYAATELNSNPIMASGTTGYTAGGDYTISVSDQVLRAVRTSNDSNVDRIVRLTNAITVTPYLPYCGRFHVQPGRGPYTGFELRFGSTTFGDEYAATTGYEAELISLAFTPYATTVHFSLMQAALNGLAGDFVEIPYASFAPCALVDNGPNLFPRSIDLNHAAWTRARITVDTTSVVLPDGSSATTNTLREDGTAANTHFLEDGVTVSGTAHDITIAGAFKAVNRTWVQIRMEEGNSATAVSAYLNLSSGALGTVSAGAQWASARSFTHPLGNGWHYFALIARKINASTSVTGRISIAEGDNDVTFTGLTQDSLYAWRPSMGPSSVPFRLTATNGTISSTGNLQNLGGGMYTKGWTASTSEIRKIGDVIEIRGQLVILTAPINSDASGRAFIQFAPVTHTAPADNTPIILNQPMGRFLLESSENGWSNVPGVFSDAEIVLAQAP